VVRVGIGKGLVGWKLEKRRRVNFFINGGVMVKRKCGRLRRSGKVVYG